MKKYTFRNNWTYDHTKTVNEVLPSNSMTVPDQSLTVREILDRFTRGLSIDQTQRNTYGYDETELDIDVPDPTLDPDFNIITAHHLNNERVERQKRARQEKEESDRIEAEKLKTQEPEDQA